DDGSGARCLVPGSGPPEAGPRCRTSRAAVSDTSPRGWLLPWFFRLSGTPQLIGVVRWRAGWLAGSGRCHSAGTWGTVSALAVAPLLFRRRGGTLGRPLGTGGPLPPPPQDRLGETGERRNAMSVSSSPGTGSGRPRLPVR